MSRVKTVKSIVADLWLSGILLSMFFTSFYLEQCIAYAFQYSIGMTFFTLGDLLATVVVTVVATVVVTAVVTVVATVV